MSRIYLDYAASAPLYPEVRHALEDYLKSNPVGNPSSLHGVGRTAQSYLDKAHTTIAAVFGVQPTEVVFTSGATESNNLAVHGVLKAWAKEHDERPHVILSAIEHPSWRQTIKGLGAEVTIVPVSQDGVVSAADMLAAIQPNTALIGCMYVNNELGTVQPIAEIGKGVERYHNEHSSRWPVFHVDAVQAFPYLNTHSGHMHADLVTISGHKYGAPAGAGALLIKKQTSFAGVTKGGSQEWGYRAGTENVLGIVGLSAAVAYSDTHREDLTQETRGLQEFFEARIKEEFPQIKILGQNAPRAPHITYLWFPSVTNESFVQKLDLAGFAVSSGSACSSGAMLPSSVLLALGMTNDEAYGGIRVSYGRFTTKDELNALIEALRTLRIC